MVPSLAASQGIALARVDDVRGVEAQSTCFVSQHVPADPQSFTRIGTPKTERLWPRDSVIFTNDRLVVQRRTDVRVRVDGTIGHGTLVFAPDLGRCPGSDVGRHIASRAPAAGNGSYEFRKDTVGRGANAPERFILVVKNGAAIVQWRSGQLQVRALDEQISNVGSAFTVLVDSVARRGIVTVQDGLVTLRSGTVAAGQSFTFGPGQPLQPVVVQTAGLDEIHFHSNDVWKNPFKVSSIPHPPIPHPSFATVRALPWKKITIGTVGIGAASYATYKFWPRKGPPPPPPVKAVVVVTLPL